MNILQKNIARRMCTMPQDVTLTRPVHIYTTATEKVVPGILTLNTETYAWSSINSAHTMWLVLEYKSSKANLVVGPTVALCESSFKAVSKLPIHVHLDL